MKSERNDREKRRIKYDTFWVREDAITHGRTRPYHWTDECVRGAEGEQLVEIPREEAEANPTLRPCKLCASRGKGQARSRRRLLAWEDTYPPHGPTPDLTNLLSRRAKAD